MRNRQKIFHNNSRTVSFFRYIIITFHGTFLIFGDFWETNYQILKENYHFGTELVNFRTWEANWDLSASTVYFKVSHLSTWACLNSWSWSTHISLLRLLPLWPQCSPWKYGNEGGNVLFDYNGLIWTLCFNVHCTIHN